MFNSVNLCRFGHLSQNNSTDIMQTQAEVKLNRLRYYLSPEAKKRLKWMYTVRYECDNNLAQAANRIGISRTWLSQVRGCWKNNREDPRSLEPESRAPLNTANRKRIDKKVENKIVEIRKRYRPWGKDKLSDVKKAFVEGLGLCRQLGMIRIGKVAIDGTKFRSDLNGNKTQYRKTLNKRKESIEEQVDGIFREADEVDRQEEKLYGDSTEHRIKGLDLNRVARELAKLKKRKASLEKKKEKLKAKKDEINSKLRRMRKDRNTMSSTDKDATLMMMKEGQIASAYNAQFATEHQVILGYGLTSDRNDFKQLKPAVKEVAANTGKKPETVTADAGYGRKMNYRYLKSERITAFIPYGQFNKEMAERRKGIYANNQDRELARYKFTQCVRLNSETGKEMMKRRREDVEPVIGDIKRNMNFRTFNLRGKPKCLIELGLISLGHNLKKMKSYLKKSAKFLKV